MTNTVALVFTGAGAAAGSRQELAGQGRLVRRPGGERSWRLRGVMLDQPLPRRRGGIR